MNLKKIAVEAFKITEYRLKEGFSSNSDVNKAENEAYHFINDLQFKLQKKYKIKTYVAIRSTDNLETSVRIDIGKA